MSDLLDVIVICGPTASGKTSLSIEMAKRINAEIVSADSMQIYKEMKIGTAKPDKYEMDDIPHHLFDIVSVTKDFNVAKYVEYASQAINEIHLRKKNVIIVGGTGLYIDSLVNNIDFFDIETDLKYREQLTELAKAKGGEYLKLQLSEVDPETASKLHKNDIKRIVRALEVFHSTGLPISKFQKLSKRNRKYNVTYIGLNYDNRETLYNRINTRVDRMIDGGLIDECKSLLGLNLSDTAKAAIGYSDIFAYLNGEISLDDAIFYIKQKSRRYAKRQLTWFRRNQEIKWFYSDRYEKEVDLFNDCYDYIQKSGVTDEVKI